MWTDCFTFASFSRLSHDVMSELMFSSLTGSLNDIKLESSYMDAGQVGLFILYFNDPLGEKTDLTSDKCSPNVVQI